MDDQRFDELVRSINSGVTRRRALRSALGGLVAGVAGATALSAEAKNKGKAEGKRKKRVQAQNIYTTTTSNQTTTTSNQTTTTSNQTTTTKKQCNPNDTCKGKKCGEYTDCGQLCGGCRYKELCVVDKHEVTCKAVPVCAPDGQPGICCSGYHKNGICCDPNDPDGVAITVTQQVHQSITVNTPPNTTIVTVNVPPAAVPPAAIITTPSVGGAGRRKRRRRGRRGGRRGGRKN